MNHGTEAKMVARRLRLLNSAPNEGLLRGLPSPAVSDRTNITLVGYIGSRCSSRVTDCSASSWAPRTASQLGLSTIKKRARVTKMAGISAVAYIQRQADTSG